jgi:hypothetical protein
MTPSRSLVRATDRCLEKEREDLESLFAEVVREAFGQDADAVSTGPAPEPGLADGVAALLAIHDEGDDTYLGVHVRVAAELATALARRTPGCDEPAREDLLAAVGELGDAAGTRLIALLFPAARLSLPSATLDDVGLPPAREGAPAPTVMRALVGGRPVELALVPHVEEGGLAWPPSLESDGLEAEA